MAKHVFIVLTNAAAGKEDAYNDWYTNTHIPDVLNVPGVVAAQRFTLSADQRAAPPHPYKYLAVYEIETDDLKGMLAILNERAGTSAMVISDAIDQTRLAWIYAPVTERIEAAHRGAAGS